MPQQKQLTRIAPRLRAAQPHLGDDRLADMDRPARLTVTPPAAPAKAHIAGLLPAPRSQDPLDGTTGELRRLTRHLLTLVVRYRGRVSLPRNRKPFERRWQVGIVGDMHTIAHDLGARGEWARGGVVITDGLGRVRRYEVLLSRKGFDRLLSGVMRAWQQTELGTWQPTETATTALEAAPPGDGWKLASITLGLRTYTWSRVRVALPPDPRKSDFLRSFDAVINRISDRRLVERARQQLRYTPIDSPDFDDLAAVANS